MQEPLKRRIRAGEVFALLRCRTMFFIRVALASTELPCKCIPLSATPLPRFVCPLIA
jgi:hypothetical protein